MRNLIFVFPLLFLTAPFSSNAQVYIDVLTAPQMLIMAGNTGGGIRGEFQRTNDNLNKIQEAQQFLNAKLAVVNDLQRRVHRGLTEVSGTVRNGLKVRQIYEASEDILAMLTETGNLVSSHPQYAVFANRSASNLKLRAIGLYGEVANILKEDDNNLLSAGERQQLLNKVYGELLLMKGAVFGINFSIKSALRNGFWRSLNPFRTWMNQDAQIMKDIIRNTNYLTN